MTTVSRVLSASALFLSLSLSLAAQPYTFRHYAGTRGGPGATDGMPSDARFWGPVGVATDAAGNLYIADTNNHVIRKVTPAGNVSTFAGLAGNAGFANGFGAAARFDRPSGVAVDASGNVFVSDANNIIRRITPGGLVTTLAGSPGTSGHVDATGAAARFFLVFGLAVDSNGNVFAAEYGTHTIRKITPAGVVTTFAGTPDVAGTANGTGAAALFNRPNGVATDSADNVYVTELVSHTIRKITSARVVTTFAGSPDVCGYADGAAGSAQFCFLRGITVDSSNSVYVTDGSSVRVRKIASGVVSTFAGSGMAVGSIDGMGTAASFMNVEGIAADGSDNLYVTESSGHVVRKITPAAAVSTLAGLASAFGSTVDAGQNARFYNPDEVAIDGNGSVFIADAANGTIRKIGAGSLTPAVFAGSPGFSGGDDGNGMAARFRQPSGVAVDPSNNIYVADRGAYTIRKITPTADVTTFAGAYITPGSDDGTGGNARFSDPNDVACDASGNVYVADTGNHTIRKITPAGVVTTLAGLAGFFGSDDGTGSAARFLQPSALIVGSDGNIYVTDLGNSTIRKVTPAGVVTTLAGSAGEIGGTDGGGASARFRYPTSIAADGSGHLYVTDSFYTIRRVTLAGTVTTIAGVFGVQGTEDGTGIVARFSNLKGIASNSAGVLFVTDGNTLRRGAPPLPDYATIDTDTGAVGAVRMLGTSPSTANIWSWSIVRRPAGSTATLISPSTRTPSFTPDVPDRYTFRLLAALGADTSVTEVSLQATAAATLTVSPATLPNATKSLDYSFTLSASGGTPPYLFSRDEGTIPPGMSLDGSGVLSGRPSMTGTFNFTVRATDSVGAVGLRSYSFVIAAGAGSALAHATSATAVQVSWPPVPSASSYNVFRSAFGTSFSLIGSSASTSYSDTSAAANTAYLYRVTAVDSALHESLPGAADLATTVLFTDSPLDAGATVVRADHVTELRTAVNAVRALAGLGSFAFADSPVDGLPIRAQHVSQLRSALDAARSSLSLAALSYTDPTLTPEATTVKAVHIEQLRNGVR